MLLFTRRIGADHPGPVMPTATLPLETRVRSRARFQLDDGREAGFVLPRGQVIRGGEVLGDDDGHVVRILSAPDHVSTVACADGLLLARVCYHLGNRHVPLQIEAGFVRYLHDHVLDDMVRGMGLTVVVEKASFEPEAGAYHGASHAHHHE